MGGERMSLGVLDTEHRRQYEAAVAFAENDGPRTARYGQDDADQRADRRLGLLAEAFVAQITGLEWTDAGAYSTDHPDVGYLDVRATAYATGRLLVHPHEPDWRPFVLVIVAGDVMRIGGWCFAFDAKASRYWVDTWRYPCFAVPQQHLSPTIPPHRDWMT